MGDIDTRTLKYPLAVNEFEHVDACPQWSYCEFQQRSHTGKQLQDEGFAVEDVELPAAELDALPQ